MHLYIHLCINPKPNMHLYIHLCINPKPGNHICLRLTVSLYKIGVYNTILLAYNGAYNEYDRKTWNLKF